MTDRTPLAAHVEALGSSRVACIGDLMLDRFVHGRVERTSPEAPVPVLRTDGDVSMLGGVGNVARNLAALGARATLLSVIGDDAVGRRLTGMVGREHRVEPHLLVERGRLSTEKTRFVADGRQLLRADSETTEPIAARSAESLAGLARDALATCDALALSDYGKGVLTPALVRRLIAAAREAGRPVAVDPKGRDYAAYAGASALTPNRAALAAAAGERVETDDAAAAACRRLAARYGIGAILVTGGRGGMILVSADGRFERLPWEEPAVFDVAGANDAALAALSTALGRGLDMAAAAALAGAAARVASGKTGTAAVGADELRQAVGEGAAPAARRTAAG